MGSHTKTKISITIFAPSKKGIIENYDKMLINNDYQLLVKMNKIMMIKDLICKIYSDERYVFMFLLHILYGIIKNNIMYRLLRNFLMINEWRAIRRSPTFRVMMRQNLKKIKHNNIECYANAAMLMLIYLKMLNWYVHLLIIR